MTKSQSLVMVGRNCNDSVQILLCCSMNVFVMLPSSVSSDWILFRFYVIICRSNTRLSSGFPPTPQDFTIGVLPTFFWVDSVTLNTPHTTEKSEKIIFRTSKTIETLPRIVGKAKNQPDYLVVCTQHYDQKSCCVHMKRNDIQSESELTEDGSVTDAVMAQHKRIWTLSLQESFFYFI